MARSRGSIHIADNSVVAINDAIQQLLFMIDEITGEHDTPNIAIGPHSHTSGSGDLISHDTGLTDVSADDHHTEDHAARHASGGLDPLKLDDLATPDDNTDLNSTSVQHGLLPKLSGSATDFLNGQGNFATVTASEAKDIELCEAQESSAVFEEILSLDGTVTITSLANGSAVDLSVSGAGGSAGKQFALMMADL